MGRPRKPDDLKILDGTFRPDRDGDPAAVVSPGGTPQRPRGMEGEARKLWDAVVPGLVATGVARECDTHQLVAMCEWWARYRSYTDALDELPASDKTYRLMVQVGIAHTNFDRIAARFGLTPSDRAKLRIDSPKKPGGGVVSRKRNA